MNGQKYTHHPFHIRLWKRTSFIYKTLARLGEGKEKFVRAICEVTIIQLSNIPQNTNHGAARGENGSGGGEGQDTNILPYLYLFMDFFVQRADGGAQFP